MHRAEPACPVVIELDLGPGGFEFVTMAVGTTGEVFRSRLVSVGPAAGLNDQLWSIIGSCARAIVLRQDEKAWEREP
jgi:hypothetical protein